MARILKVIVYIVAMFVCSAGFAYSANIFYEFNDQLYFDDSVWFEGVNLDIRDENGKGAYFYFWGEDGEYLGFTDTNGDNHMHIGNKQGSFEIRKYTGDPLYADESNPVSSISLLRVLNDGTLELMHMEEKLRLNASDGSSYSDWTQYVSENNEMVFENITSGNKVLTLTPNATIKGQDGNFNVTMDGLKSIVTAHYYHTNGRGMAQLYIQDNYINIVNAGHALQIGHSGEAGGLGTSNVIFDGDLVLNNGVSGDFTVRSGIKLKINGQVDCTVDSHANCTKLPLVGEAPDLRYNWDHVYDAPTPVAPGADAEIVCNCPCVKETFILPLRFIDQNIGTHNGCDVATTLSGLGPAARTLDWAYCDYTHRADYRCEQVLSFDKDPFYRWEGECRPIIKEVDICVSTANCNCSKSES